MNVERRTRSLIKAGAAVDACAHAGADRSIDGGAPAAGTVKPLIVLHKTGERIDAIEVTCPCGHTMVLDCEYAD